MVRNFAWTTCVIFCSPSSTIFFVFIAIYVSFIPEIPTLYFYKWYLLTAVRNSIVIEFVLIRRLSTNFYSTWPTRAYHGTFKGAGFKVAIKM